MTNGLHAPARLHRLLEAPVERRPLDAGSPIVIYGAGNTGRRVIAFLRARGIEPTCVLDQRGAGSLVIEGVPVHHPGREPFDNSLRARATVVVAVFNRDADVRAINTMVQSLGYGRIVGVVELHDLLAEQWGDAYWMAPRDHTARHAEDVILGMNRLADRASRELFERIIAYRCRGDAADAPQPVGGLQYFPADVPRRGGALRYVDCGAYDGDALRSAEQVADLEAACAFEPDPSNFEKLAAWTVSSASSAEIQLWPCAVWSVTQQLHFSAGEGEASHLTASGTTLVQGVAIDDALPSFQATDLKMDVEGAEPEALEGAERLIVRCRPRLAVCAYHRPEHLWSLSAAVGALDLDYTFFLRAHAHGGFDVVLYAIPNEQCTR
jgi:FkbM family methyltransferase